MLGTFLFLNVSVLGKGMPSEYYEIRESKKSKKYFFDYINDLVQKENEKILKEREFVKNILSSNILSINYNSNIFLQLLEIKKRYRVKNLFTLEEYLKKINIIPASMALAQAAVESGWGKSRFIKEANNIFGHWTYDPKIGMMPEQRDEDATHFIRIFKNLQDSISAYMLNLNRNRAYKTFQNKRYELIMGNKKLDGLTLSQTMLNYSGIAEEYLKMLKLMIESNSLLKYDKYRNINKLKIIKDI